MTITFYKLKSALNNDLEIYVGSTKNFSARKSKHKADCQESNVKVYRYIRANGGYDNWTYEIIAQINNMSRYRRFYREGQFAELHNATLNTNKAGNFLRYGNQNLYNHFHQNNTTNVCDRCGTLYRSKTNRNVHQQTAKCQRLALLRNN